MEKTDKKYSDLCGQDSHFCAYGCCVRKYMPILIIIICLFLVVKIVSEYKTMQFIGQGITPQNVIVVSGKGEVSAPANIAEFSFSVTEEAKTVKEAQNMAAKKSNQSLDILRKSGIEEKDIKTADYSVNPRYEYREVGVACVSVNCPPVSSTRVLVGYEVSQTISVKVRDVEKVGDIMSSVGEVGVSYLSSLNFSIDNEDNLKREARQKAIMEAKNKAKQLSGDLDVDLLRIVNFSESGNYPMYGRYGVSEAMMSVSKDSGVPEIPVGENKIVSNVTITYEIK